MKANMLLSVFIYFSESGLFKRLRRKKIKKTFPFLARATGCGRGRFSNRREPSRLTSARRVGSVKKNV
jgi:hypothetical protein